MAYLVGGDLEKLLILQGEANRRVQKAIPHYREVLEGYDEVKEKYDKEKKAREILRNIAINDRKELKSVKQQNQYFSEKLEQSRDYIKGISKYVIDTDKDNPEAYAYYTPLLANANKIFKDIGGTGTFTKTGIVQGKIQVRNKGTTPFKIEQIPKFKKSNTLF